MPRLSMLRRSAALTALAVAAALSLSAIPSPAEAGRSYVRGGWGGHHHGWPHGGWHHGGGSFVLGLGLGFSTGVFAAPRAYGLPPVVYAPPPGMAATPTSPIYLAPSGQHCREFQSTGVVGGRPVPIYGTACLGPDGEWRVVR